MGGAFQNTTNSFLEEGQHLYNLVTKVVMPTDVQQDIRGQSDVGKQLSTNFVKDRIQTNCKSEIMDKPWESSKTSAGT